MSSTARHSRAESSRGRGRFALVSLVVLSAGLGGVGFAVTWASSSDRPCPPVVQVAASPDIAPVVGRVADRLTPPEESCASFRVRALDAATVAASLRAGTAADVDVWVPDSSLWLQRAGRMDDSEGPVAHSPVVLATAPVLGNRVTTDGAAAGMAAVAPRDGRRPVRIALRDPRESARSSAALLGLRSALSSRADSRRVLAGLLQSAEVSTETDNLAEALEVTPGTAVPASEQQVFALNRAEATPRVLALYAAGLGSVLDYPFALLAGSVSQHARAARLLAALHGDAGSAGLNAAGFRDHEGTAGGALEDTLGLDAQRPGAAPLVRAADVAEAVTGLSSIRQRANLLAVIDVSGSMAARVPGTGASRMGLVRRAAARGLALYPDRNSVGLWTFSTRQRRNLDHRPLLLRTVLGRAGDPSGGRARLAVALDRIRPTDGDTGLYDTILAAVRSQRRSWMPGHTNAVLLLTDGRNRDPRGIDLPALLRTLQREQDPARPVPVIAIAYGANTVAETALRRVNKVTGGTTYTAHPRQIDQVLLDALGQRSCRPLCPAASLS